MSEEALEEKAALEAIYGEESVACRGNVWRVEVETSAGAVR